MDKNLGSSQATGFFEKLRRQWRRIKSEYAIYKNLRKKDLKDTILHIETAPWQSWILLYFLTKKVNVFVTMHNAMTDSVSNWRKIVWKIRLNFLMKSDKFHFFSANQNAIDSLKKYISEQFWDKLILTRATINPIEINNVLENSAFSREKILKKNNLPVGKFIVLCVGQFIDRKGRWVFLESAANIVEKKEDIVFVWLTPQMPSKEDFDRIRSYGLGEKFRLILSSEVGKKREDVLNFFRIADVFTLPSLWEGLPIAILEAMALGIPTISTDLNAIPEAVKHLETGILVQTNNREELVEAIIKLYDNKDLRQKLAKHGREFVLENFDEKKAAAIVLENYEKCLNH